MKYVLVLGDGMADLPLRELNYRTPLEAAKTPWMDFLAKEGSSGLLKTLPETLPLGSDIANLGILGYNPQKYYPGGRGPFEALIMGAKLHPGEIAIRFNFISEKKGKMESYFAGDISTPEAKELTKELNKRLLEKKGEMRFYSGEGYRGILILKNSRKYSEKVLCQAPHKIKKKVLKNNLVKGLGDVTSIKTAKLLNELALSSKTILVKHPVNKKRISEKKLPANMIWFWGPGKHIPFKKFKDKFNVAGAMVSGVTLLKGMGTAIGLEIIKVPGATSEFDTNYQGKADYALKSLKTFDFVYLHIKAPDDLSHQKDLPRKIQAIEKIDKLVIKKLYQKLKGKEFKIAILPDHLTSSLTGKHLPDPVPFTIYDGKTKDSVEKYSEKAARKGSYGLINGYEFMSLFLENERRKRN